MLVNVTLTVVNKLNYSTNWTCETMKPELRAMNSVGLPFEISFNVLRIFKPPYVALSVATGTFLIQNLTSESMLNFLRVMLFSKQKKTTQG